MPDYMAMEQPTAAGSKGIDRGRAAPGASRYRRAVVLVVLLGLAVQIFLNARAWLGGDQLHLLNLGLDLAVDGELYSFAKMKDGAGSVPAALLQLLVGLPLMIWPDFHAPLLLIGLTHLAAGLLLYRTLREAGGRQLATVFLLVYWLSPWRLYNAGFLWEPSFVFLPAALHFWACWRSRRTAAWWPSLVLAASLVLLAQIHASFFVLVLLTLFLALRRLLRLHPGGLLLGGLIGLLPLLPAVLELLSTGTLPPTRPDNPAIGSGLLQVAPVLKGALYWFRLGSVDIGTPLKETVFLQDAWTIANPGWSWLEWPLRLLQGIGALTILLSFYVNWRFFRQGRSAAATENSAEDWLRGYAWWSFVALVLAAALSPITLQSWMVIVVLPAACLPLACWLHSSWLRSPRRRCRTAAALIVIPVSIMLLVGSGKAIFRPGKLPAGLDPARDTRIMNILPEYYADQ